MTTTELHSETAIETPRARTVDMKLEVVVDWPNWYAAYMVAEQAGKPLPS